MKSVFYDKVCDCKATSSNMINTDAFIHSGVPKNVPISHKNDPFVKKKQLIFGYSTIRQLSRTILWDTETFFGTPDTESIMNTEMFKYNMYFKDQMQY